MGWEFFCVVGFHLGPLLQGQTRICMLSSHYYLHKSKTQSADTVPIHGHSPLVFICRILCFLTVLSLCVFQLFLLLEERNTVETPAQLSLLKRSPLPDNVMLRLEDFTASWNKVRGLKNNIKFYMDRI